MRKITRMLSMFALCCIATFLISLGVVTNSYSDDPVMISPYKIVLNAKCKGSEQDIQAIISKAIVSSSYTITDFSVTLKLGDIVEFKAMDLRYCPIDQNFLATFNREEIQSSEAVKAMAGSVVTAYVQGSYTAGGLSGNFAGTSSVEILNPGTK